MFLVSTRYGIIACQYLKETFGQGIFVSAPDIAQRYNMNVRSLMPALRQLTRAGILVSRVGGKQPGFMFARDPKEISMLDILTALEKPLAMTCCKEMIPGLKCDCAESEQCAFYQVNNKRMKELYAQLACTLLAKSVE